MKRGAFIRNLFGAVVSAIVIPKIPFAVTKPVDLVAAKNIAGFCVVSRRALRDIAFLQAWIPERMAKQLLELECDL